MNATIHLSGLEVFGHHGVFPEERDNGQLFVVDLDVEFDAGPAAGSDDVGDTLDYAKLAQAIHDEVSGEPVDLLETLASRIVRRVFTFPRAQHATVTIHKPQAPMPVSVAGVSVTLSVGRDEVVD